MGLHCGATRTVDVNMRVLWVLCILAAVVLLQVKAQEDEEELVLAALRSCSEQIKPSDDDMTQISEGKLQSQTSKALITCLLKRSEVMRDKTFQKEKAVIFLRAVVPGDDTGKIDMFKKLSEKCASKESTIQKNSTEEETAVTIYECLVKVGQSMGLDVDGDMPTNKTSST